jgi:NAD(P)-dependent dehydrogenase (short-subunit alcohol dehydrogenase family)
VAMTSHHPHALITGASTGLGRALARALARTGWQLTLDARHPDPLEAVRIELAALTTVQALPGDVADPAHRSLLLGAAARSGAIDLLVNNASELGGSPPPPLRQLDDATMLRLLAVNVAAPHALTRAALPQLAEHAVVLNLSSDAAVEHYEGWGGYAGSKAALDHLTLTWAVEEPRHRFYAVDPGDLRTAMHQAAFPGEDISDRPEPESVTPTLLRLVASGLPSGRYRVADLAERLAPAEPDQVHLTGVPA